MKKNKKGESFDEFRSSESWNFVEVPREYRKMRKKIPDELFEKLRKHMQRMYQEGTPIVWIAKFYEYDKAHVSRIIRGIPNN